MTIPLDQSRIVITGGDGMIGQAFTAGIKLTQEDLDVRFADQVTQGIAARNPSAIIHLAAVDINRAEANPSLAIATNIVGTHNVAIAARALGIPMVFLSSGAVFSGEKGSTHDELSPPKPVNVYGYTKYVSELALAELYPDALIVRTGWVFGGSQKFHKKFVDIAIEAAQKGEPISATNDRFGTPTYVADVVGEILRLLDAGTKGIVHVVNQGTASANDIAQEVVAALDSKSQITAAVSVDKPGAPPRPASEALASRIIKLRPWQEALREYITKKASS